MATVEEALKSQIAKIEAEYGRTMKEWAALIAKSGLTKHTEVVAMLKRDHGLKHGAAHRVSLVTRGQEPAKTDLFTGKHAALKPIADRILACVGEVELAPKKGYVSLRRKKQFAMLKPASTHVDVGLVLPDAPVTKRLESAKTFNALFTHRVRVRSPDEVDAELRRWLTRARDAAS